MKRGLLIGAVLAALWIGVWGCSKAKEESKGVEKAGALPAVAVEATPVQARDLIEGIEVVGSLTPRFEARLKAEYSGIVSEVYVTEWIRVKKGTPLAKLDTREIETIVQKAQAAVEVGKANLLQAEVGGNRAERELTRAQNLKEAGLITQQLFEDVKTEKAASVARIAAAKAQVLAAEKDLRQAQTRMSKAVIQSPMDGVVASRNINVGDLVGEPGTTRILFQIVDNRLLGIDRHGPLHRNGTTAPGSAFDLYRRCLSGETLFRTDQIHQPHGERGRSFGQGHCRGPQQLGNPEGRAFCQRPDYHRTTPECIANSPVRLALLGCGGQKRGGFCC